MVLSDKWLTNVLKGKEMLKSLKNIAELERRLEKKIVPQKPIEASSVFSTKAKTAKVKDFQRVEMDEGGVKFDL